MLQKSPERRIGQVLLAPYRLSERLIKVIWKKLFRRGAGESAIAPSEYHKWLEHHRATPRDLDRMRQEALAFANQPLVSIVTPVFNTPVPWLTECVESVLTQAYEKWELILVDDDSTDPETLGCFASLRHGTHGSSWQRMKSEAGFPPPQIAVSPSRRASGWAFSITMMSSSRMHFFKT